MSQADELWPEAMTSVMMPAKKRMTASPRASNQPAITQEAYQTTAATSKSMPTQPHARQMEVMGRAAQPRHEEKAGQAHKRSEDAQQSPDGNHEYLVLTTSARSTAARTSPRLRRYSRAD